MTSLVNNLGSIFLGLEEGLNALRVLSGLSDKQFISAHDSRGEYVRTMIVETRVRIESALKTQVPYLLRNEETLHAIFGVKYDRIRQGTFIFLGELTARTPALRASSFHLLLTDYNA